MEDFDFKSSKLLMKPEDRIFIYTDGVVEAQNAEEKFYGEDRLIGTINSYAANPKENITKIRADIESFSSGASQFDDITMLDVRYLANKLN